MRGDGWDFFDLYTHTETANHAQVRRMFTTLLKKKTIFIHIPFWQLIVQMPAFPARTVNVEGVCPFCKAPGARGDQCDVCGKPL